MTQGCHEIQMMDIDVLKPYASNARTHSKKQIAQIARSIGDLGFNNPILIDENQTVIAGHGRILAARKLGIREVPTVRLDHMSEAQKKAYRLADNKIAEAAGWDPEILKIELQHLIEIDVDYDLTLTGFETPEIDLILNDGLKSKEEDAQDEFPLENEIPKRVSRGDLWRLGSHLVYCGDSLLQESFDIVLGDDKADLVFTDPPYNVAIDGHVCGKGKVKHAEFAFASGEMSAQEFTEFLTKSFRLLRENSRDGSIHYICMDWRHVGEITTAGRQVYADLKNICIWNKQLGGMGSLYRSQHEMVFVFKQGDAPHINNIALGKYGRNRTNIWDYPGVHVSNNHAEELKLHPTVKPVQMIADAIIDCSQQRAIVLDSFAGSGSALLAAERTKRLARVIEYEPGYCDVILYRFEKMTGIVPEHVRNTADV